MPSSTARELAAVPIPGYSWMRLEQSFEGGMSRYFVTTDSPRSSGTSGTSTDDTSSDLEGGLRMFTLPEGVSLAQIYTGDYGGDGTQDILLRLSDGAILLLEPREEEAPRVASLSEAEEPYDPELYDPEPYDPEPTESRIANVQEPAAPSGRGGSGSTPSAPPPPGRGENTIQISPSAKDGI